MEKWDYKVILVSGGGFSNTIETLPQQLEAQLQTLGSEGWEAISCALSGQHIIVVLKKRVQ